MWRRYLRLLGPDVQADVDDELEFHIDMRARELSALGTPAGDARAEAERRFGNLRQVRDACRQLEEERERSMTRLTLLSDLGHDLVYAARSLRRQPGFTAAAVLTLAMGIGVNAAIFSAVSTYLLKPLPVRAPEELLVMAGLTSGSEVPGNITYANFRDIRARRDVLEDATAFDLAIVNMRVDGDGERRFIQTVSGNFFTTLGIDAQRGRLFGEEDEAQRIPVLVLSESFWVQRFNSDPGVIGRVVRINGFPFTITAVLPRGFRGPQTLIEPDAYAPLLTTSALIYPGSEKLIERRDRFSVKVMARLKEGVSVEQARGAMESLARDLERQFPDANKGLRIVVAAELRSRPEMAVAGVVPWLSSVFLALVGLVLLVACANVANLLLARAASRRTEIAVRRAIGATPWRLVRQLLTESLLLAALSLAGGVVLAKWAISWLSSLRLAVNVPIVFALEMDWRVFGYAALTALIAGVVAGIAPALQGTRVPLSESLKDGSRGGSGSVGRSRARNVLVVAQVAVSLVLLISAALFSRSVQAAARADFGFRPDSLLMLSLDVGLQRYDSARAGAFYRRLLNESRAIPGVAHAGLARDVPLGGSNSSVDIFLEHPTATLDDGHTDIYYNTVSEDYFAAMGHRVLQGRDFESGDAAGGVRVVIVNQVAAERFWPNESAVGKRIRLRSDGPMLEVVGVVNNAKLMFLNETPRPLLYLPLSQHHATPVTLHLRTTVPPSSLAAVARSTITTLDPELLVYDVKSMAIHLRDGVGLFFVRMGAMMAGAVGLLGLAQTLVGLFGVLSYTVSQRTREIGIRLALGATAMDVVRTVLGQGALLVGIGLALGLALSFALTRLMSSLLYGISAWDATAYVGACLVLGSLGIVSCYLPARRAAKLEPSLALRRE